MSIAQLDSLPLLFQYQKHIIRKKASVLKGRVLLRRKKSPGISQLETDFFLGSKPGSAPGRADKHTAPHLGKDGDTE